MNDLLKHQLRFVILPTRFYPEHYKTDMEAAYENWKSVWGQALTEEMNVKDQLYSDNFSRQSHVAMIFYKDEFFALTTLNVLDLDQKVCRDDSYFKVWPEEAVIKLKSQSRIIMTCCNLTLNFKFRKNSLGVSGKDLMFAMLVEYLKNANVDSIVAAVRLEKGIERSAYRTGAIPLEKDLPYSIPGQRVDLVCWKRNLDSSLIDPELRALTKYIWSNSTEIFEDEFIQGVKHAA